jgi:hypothetical protein
MGSDKSIEVVRCLERAGLSFRGPIRTRKGSIIFLIETHILTVAELVQLLDTGALGRDRVLAFARSIAGNEPHLESID